MVEHNLEYKRRWSKTTEIESMKLFYLVLVVATATQQICAHDDDEDHDHDHDHDEDDAANNDVIMAKVWTMVCLCVASFICGMLPYVITRLMRWDIAQTHSITPQSHGHSHGTSQLKSNIWITLLLAFGGGVLLATTFLHLQPELTHHFEELAEAEIIDTSEGTFWGTIHMPQFLMCCGFFLMFLIEECVHIFMANYYERNNKKTELHGSGNFKRDSVLRKSLQMVSHTDNASQKADDGTVQVPQDKDDDMGHKVTITNNTTVEMKVAKIAKDAVILSSLRSLLIVLALSIHELFEGLAVGLETTAATVWYMFAAVSAHKLVLAFCIGLELLANQTKRTLMICYVLFFSIVSPIGIGIGILLQNGQLSSTQIQLVSLVLQGFASGTLLYVIFFEILQKDRIGLKQFVVIITGFMLMIGLQFVGEYIML